MSARSDRNVVRNEEYPPPPGLLESTRYVAKEGKIFDFKGLTGKILKTKEISPADHFPGVLLNRYGAVGGVLSQLLVREFAGGFRNGKGGLVVCGAVRKASGPGF